MRTTQSRESVSWRSRSFRNRPAELLSHSARIAPASSRSWCRSPAIAGIAPGLHRQSMPASPVRFSRFDELLHQLIQIHVLRFTIRLIKLKRPLASRPIDQLARAHSTLQGRIDDRARQLSLLLRIRRATHRRANQLRIAHRRTVGIDQVMRNRRGKMSELDEPIADRRRPSLVAGAMFFTAGRAPVDK